MSSQTLAAPLPTPPLPTTSSSSSPTFSSASNTNRIAFASNRDGNFEIYTMAPDGKDVRRLTHDPSSDRQPAWNRDHSKLAFVSERDGNSEIYVLNFVNGQASGEAQRITHDPARDRAPSWNPEGDQLVFESYRVDRLLTALCIVNVSTRVVRQLTQTTDFEAFSPTWAPQGDLIAFVSSSSDVSSFREGPPRTISTIKSNGQDLKQITMGARRRDNDPAWHPDGQTLSFERPFVGLFTIKSDGTNEKLLAPNTSEFLQPSYSSDGNRVVCVGHVVQGEGLPKNSEIFVLDVNNPSETPIRLTAGSDQNIDARW